MPWWGKSQESTTEQSKQEPKGASQNGTFDPQKLPAVEKLPNGLQKIVDKADQDGSLLDDISDG